MSVAARPLKTNPGRGENLPGLPCALEASIVGRCSSCWEYVARENPCRKPGPIWGLKLSKGYVYVLTNVSMPGLVKIGRTMRSAAGRASELYQTGVPTPFCVADQVFAPDCAALELTMHRMFAEFRVNESREFFRVNAAEACGSLHTALMEQLGDFVKEFAEDYVLSYCAESVSVDDLYEACDGTDAHPWELAGAIRHLDKDAVQDAVNQLRAQISARKAIQSVVTFGPIQ